MSKPRDVVVVRVSEKGDREDEGSLSVHASGVKCDCGFDGWKCVVEGGA